MTPEQFARALLAALGIAAPSDATVSALVTWMAAEGGAGPQWGIAGNLAAYNPLNTTLDTPGSVPTPGNTPPVRGYGDWSAGIAATAATLSQPNMAPIVAALHAGCDCAGLAQAVAATPWGTGDFSHLCGAVPAPPPPPAPADPAPQPSPSTGGDTVNAPELRQGATGRAVRVVQLVLNDTAHAGLSVDGIFGPLTDGAVRSWQAFWHITEDGIVGPVTWGTLVAFG